MLSFLAMYVFILMASDFLPTKYIYKIEVASYPGSFWKDPGYKDPGYRLTLEVNLTFQEYYSSSYIDSTMSLWAGCTFMTSITLMS